jgi:hypothetical protein
MVHVREDGEIWGEYLTPECGRRLPENFRVDLTERFFNIPEALTHHTLETTPHHEEIILALVTPSGHWLCSFTMSELPHESPMRAALDDLLNKLKDWAEQGTGG